MSQSGDIVNQLVGEVCWGVTAGPGTGSMVNFSIGEKIERERASANPHLGPDEAKYTGEYSLFVQNCAWRLLKKRGGIICTSKSENSRGGELVRGVNRMRGRRIVGTNLDSASLDLRISLEDSLTLCLFCDCMDDEEDGENYSIFTPDRVYIVGPRSQLIIEERSS